LLLPGGNGTTSFTGCEGQGADAPKVGLQTSIIDAESTAAFNHFIFVSDCFTSRFRPA
jgi:hypothetical protein